jgi:hypothetical protein
MEAKPILWFFILNRPVCRQFIKTSCLFGLCFFLQNCTITHETPSLQQKVNLITPVNRLVTVNSKQNFTWTAIPGVIYYELKLVSPNFDDASSIIADTTVFSNSLSRELAPGRYEWCVKALNSTSLALFSDTNILTVH